MFQKRTDSLLAPGAVVLDDLNGDGKKDLVVANSGSNNVLIYPGLGNGQFGPAVNGGHGFSTGTDPVGITVADVNGDRKPDLVVANKGSNAVSILLNQSQGNSITFTPGPRLKAGSGPLSTVVKDVTGDGIPDLLVSNSQSNNVMLLPGVGGGFFNDQNPRIIALPTSPGPMYPFGPGVVVLNPGSNTVTLISDFMGTSPLTRSFGSGGLDPVAAVVFHSDNGFDNLIVANNDDGHVVLLEGSAEGLILDPDIQELLKPDRAGAFEFHRRPGRSLCRMPHRGERGRHAIDFPARGGDRRHAHGPRFATPARRGAAPDRHPADPDDRDLDGRVRLERNQRRGCRGRFIPTRKYGDHGAKPAGACQHWRE